jgi:hypothetical protein
MSDPGNGTVNPAAGIPIFDSLTHPTITGGWMGEGSSGSADIRLLEDQMRRQHVRWALAVGMKGIGGYEENAFIDLVKSSCAELFPIAFIDPVMFNGHQEMPAYLKALKMKGYRGVKVHPRISGIRLSHPNLPDMINYAAELGMPSLICTYPYSTGMDQGIYSLEVLASLLDKTQGCRIILMHAGCVRLLEMIEIARCFGNVLLDMSFTLCKYEGSSIDLDISYAFNQFDRRICIGSDFPEFDLGSMRNRFMALARNLPQEKMENIAYMNLMRFMEGAW